MSYSVETDKHGNAIPPRKVKTYDVAVYKHINGKWIPKYTITQYDLEEMQKSPFVQIIRIFTEEEWRQLQENAQKSGVKLSALLEGYP